MKSKEEIRFEACLHNAIASHPEIKQRRKRDAYFKVELNEKYQLEYCAWEEWSDPGICEVTYSYSAYGRRWHGWLKIFYAESSRWGLYQSALIMTMCIVGSAGEDLN